MSLVAACAVRISISASGMQLRGSRFGPEELAQGCSECCRSNAVVAGADEQLGAPFRFAGSFTDPRKRGMSASVLGCCAP